VDRDAHELARPLVPAALQVAVVGGGWAGIACAVEATRRGHRVTLLEMAPQLGGRARRVDTDEGPLDNGQHILIGGYRETLRLMRDVGVDVDAAFLRTPLRLATAEGHGLQLPPGHPLLAFARGVLAARGWSLSERVALLATASGWAVRGFRSDECMTVAELIAGLPRTIRDDLLDPLCVAALNTPARSASASVFLRVIRDALFSGPGSADLLLPRWRLSALLPDPAAAWLDRAGATVCTSSRVEQLQRSERGWLVDGESFDHVVIATTAVEAARLAAPFAPPWADLAGALRHEPIVTLYAESAGAALPQPMLALRSDEQHLPAQFVFDHGHLDGRSGLLAFVISGAQPWLDRGINATRDATLKQAEQSLRPHLRGPLRMVQVFTEKRATFRCTPGLRRPPSRIAEGLHAAGDYIDGPYPATLEGAVLSAMAAVGALSGVRTAPPAARR